MKKILCGLLVACAIVFSVTAIGGSPVKIDGSTEETTTASIQAMRKDLSNKENCLLTTAFFRIQVADQVEQAKKTGDPKASATPLGPKINGMDYEQIIKFSEKFPASVTPLCRN